MNSSRRICQPNTPSYICTQRTRKSPRKQNPCSQIVENTPQIQPAPWKDDSQVCSGILGDKSVRLLRQYRSFLEPDVFPLRCLSLPDTPHSKESNRVKTLRHAATTSSCNSLSLPLFTSCNEEVSMVELEDH